MALRIGNRIFSAAAIPTAVTLVLAIALLSLGRWQLSRMHEKQALFAAFAAGARSTIDLSLAPPDGVERFQHVAAIGRYDAAHQFLLDNLTHHGRAGFQVLTPLIIDAGRTVLVNRGWVPLGTQRDRLPDVSVAETERSVTGRLNALPSPGIELESAPTPAEASWPRVVNYPKMRDLEAALRQPLYPMILQLDPDQPDGFVREWRPATFAPERHLGYAITWFALAAALLVIYVIANLRVAPGSARADSE